MSQRDGFAGGFLAGTIIGGIVGGIVGAIAVSQITSKKSKKEPSWLEDDQQLSFNTEEGMEMARRSLEDKISQLNSAIDDVRQQMSVIHPNGSPENHH